MNAPDHFEMREGIGFFHPVGRFTLERAVDLVAEAIFYAREQKVPKLLVNTCQLVGFDPPTMADRYFFVHDWVRAAGGEVCVAMVTRPEMIHPEKFGVTVAASTDLATDVFESEEEALAWLEKVA